MKNILFTLLSIAILASCTPKKNAEEEKEQKVIHDIDKILADLPNPSAIPFTLKSINAAFADSLVNDIENLSKYAGDDDKLSLNMGVYSTDVSYLASYEKPDLTMKYVKACHQIGETLGDTAIFEQDLLDKIEANLGDEKELSVLLRGMIVETSLQLEKDHHLSMAALALTGAFIEELYQAVNVIENYHTSDQTRDQDKKTVEPLVKLVMAQQEPLLDLITLLKDIPHNDTILNMITQLGILDRLYKNDLANIKAQMDADSDYIVDRDEMLAITLSIESIREGLVE